MTEEKGWVKAAIGMFNAGWSVADIARQTNRPYTTVHNALYRRGYRRGRAAGGWRGGGEHRKAIASMGGKAVAAKYGSEYMAALGRKSGERKGEDGGTTE